MAGAAYFFERNNSGSWVEAAKVTASDAGPDDEFGFSVAISGTYSVIGARNEDEAVHDGGAAYFFGLIPAPELYNLTAEATSATSATFYVDVADGGATTTYTFDYGTASDDYSLSYSNTIAGNSATVNVGFEDTENLMANTQYFVRASATNSVTWTESEEISFWTLIEEPLSHSSLSQIGEENTTIELNFDAFSTITNATGYLILRSNATIGENDLPVDGTAYNVNDTFGNSTVVADITDNSATSHTFTGLSQEKSWQFAIIPYNRGDNVATTNYKTDNVPTISGFTIPTLGEWGMMVFGGLMLIGGVWYIRRAV